MAHYSVSQRRWVSFGPRHRHDDEGGVADPYSSALPGYRERMRETVTTLPSGLTRVDLGAPVNATAGQPEPVSSVVPEEPEDTSVPDAEPLPFSTPTLADIAARTTPPDIRRVPPVAMRPGIGHG